MKALFLYGPPGSGKSTLGKLFAKRLAVPFVDLDAEIVSAAGRSIPEIFAGEGEAGFRVRELRALEEVASRDRCVVALGGGALVADAARAVAERSGTVICLDCSLDVLAVRIDNAPGERPLVAGDTRTRLEGLMARRSAHYASFSLRLDVSAGDPESLVDRLEVVTGLFRITTGDTCSNIHVGAHLLDSIGDFARDVGLGKRAVVVCDSNTAPLFGERVVKSLENSGIAATCFEIPAGEETKTLDTVQTIWQAFLKAGLGRSDFAVAVGGGVVGDMTGFAAATWMRGMKWVNVSTSLLSMVDASTGGKTGCDLPTAKNMIGAFHSPSVVVIDTETLSTLPPREIRCGLAEAIKHAIISDPALMGHLRSADAALPNFGAMVARALAVKVDFVRRDPFEKGDRAKLNLGHTVGHAVEIATDFKYAHGEAVAIGTVEEARLAVQLGLAPANWPDEVAAAFASVGLPTQLPDGITFESLAAIMRLDKKKKDGKVRFALPCAWGDVRLVYVEV